MAGRKAMQMCAGVPEDVRPFAAELAENVSAMKRKLSRDRRAILAEPLSVEYDNGGGQSGVRRNPAIDAYNQLMANYRKSLEQLMGILADYPPPHDGGCANELARIMREAEEAIANAG